MAPVIAALPVIGQVLGVVSAAKSLVGGSKGPSMPAAVAPPPAMPTSDPAKQAQARQQMTAQRQAAGGRQSTILSSAADSGNTRLGG